MSPHASTPLVLVAGGKGGVGKSTVAVNLALAAAREGRRTLLVDLDLGLGDVALLLGLTEVPDLGTFLRGERRLDELVVRGPEGLDVLAAEQGDGALATGDGEARERLLAALDELAADHDLVVADAPAGIGPDVLAWSRAARRVLVVTTPEPTSMTDAYGFLKAVDAEAARLGADLPTPELFVNLVADRGEAHRTADHLAAVALRFLSRSPRCAGWMPRGRAVLRAVAQQRPFVLAEPASGAARAVDRLRDHLLGALVPRAKAIV